ncbi:2-C-methyl-D-erythritol 4-phosphate cytidylyltransferase [Nocardioides insulae]|uniref:2-C-methyl-D-erythritol 4-phosphate cytidylyltransferase n=1 Tax=Nocardioides insulae TaxID=394734 RepID=UPI000414F8DE|nr:2-C-methyl-D-erythritol 4-phosphate cytidylyltransferase [Nocardioides insulae]
MNLPAPLPADQPAEPIDLPDLGPVLGAVVEEERGALPFSLIHGEALVACAAWALGEAGVTPVDQGTTWEAVAASGEAFVLHDALCPMTPAWFVSRCVETALERGAVVIGVRPVTDTVKRLEVGDGVAVVGETLDRDRLCSIASPVVLPPEVVATLAEWPSTDFGALADDLAARLPVLTIQAPPEARRVASVDEVRLLEALTSR